MNEEELGTISMLFSEVRQVEWVTQLKLDQMHQTMEVYLRSMLMVLIAQLIALITIMVRL